MSTRRGTLGAMDSWSDPYPPPPPPGQDELPCQDGEPMDTPRHAAQMTLLIDSLSTRWSDRHDYFVGGNMFVYYSELQSKGSDFRGPDVFVALDVDHAKRRKSWVAWQEGGRLPDVVIELLSHSTERVDRTEKMRLYERVWRTGHYVLFDPETLVLEGYELVRGTYARLAPDAAGRLSVASMGLSLGLAPGRWIDDAEGLWLRWFDAEGKVLPTSAEAARADAAMARERADAAEARVAALEAKLRER